MDIVTNTLVGIALSRVFFKKRVAFATVGLIVACNLPDLDMVYSWPGIRYLEYHRGALHSVWMLPVWGVLVAWGLRALARWRHKPAPGWAAGFALGVAGVGAHLVLDWCNAYGVRLLAPFSEHWFAADWLPGYDPWIWFILAAFLGLPMLLNLVTAEVGSKLKPTHRVSAAIALVLVAGWIAVRARQHQAATAVLGSQALAEFYDNQKPLAVAAFPVDNSPFAWYGVADLPHNYAVSTVAAPWDTFQTQVKPMRSYIKPPQSELLTRAESTHTGQVFLWYARFPYSSQQAEANLNLVVLTDMRFAEGYQQPSIRADVTLDQAMKVVGQSFRW